MAKPRFWIANDLLDDNTLRAEGLTPGSLKHAIMKWEYLLLHGNRYTWTGGPFTCALCMKYNTEEMSDVNTCKRCPVYIKTNSPYCHNTPLDKIVSRDIRSNLTTEEWQAIVREEIEFLRGLKKSK